MPPAYVRLFMIFFVFRFTYNDGASSVTCDIYRCTSHIEDTVNAGYQCNTFYRKTNALKYHCEHYHARTRNTCSTDGSKSCC